MKKLVVLFVTIFCGTLFAAAEGDAGASVSPQRISHPLTKLPPELLQGLIFPHLSDKDQQAFRSLNWEAHFISPRALTFNMQSVEGHEISRVSNFLADRKDIKTLKIICLRADCYSKQIKASLLIPTLTSLRDADFRFHSLNDLDLSYNADLIPLLYNIMPLAPNLMGLNVGSCLLRAEGVNLIRQMIPHLRSLNIWHNLIGPTEADAIAQMLCLTALNISANDIGPTGAISIAQMPHLTYLNISSNKIGDVGAAAIARIPNLVHLSIRHNNIEDAGAVAIAQIPNLRTLDIRGNKIGPAGGIAIAQMPHLTYLNIRYDLIGPAGIAALNHLAQTRPMKILYSY